MLQYTQIYVRSNIIHFLLSAPTPVRNLTTTPGMTNVTAMWLEPLQPNGNVTYFYDVIDEMNVTVMSGSTDDFSVTVGGLEIFTNYTFRVTGSTSGGSGIATTEMFTTLQGSMSYLCIYVYSTRNY